MVKSLDPPELAISSAEGLSFIEYTSAFSTLCSPDRNHREMELRQRKKLKQNLDEPLSQQFYVLNDPNAAGLLVPERELAPCCAKALAALRWWSWLDATLCIGSSNEVRARLSKAKCYRPQWVSENGKLRGISQLDGPKFTTAQRYSIVTWLYRAANPIEGARPEWVGRGRKYPYEVESFIKIFLREYAIAGGDPAPSRPLDAHRAQTSFDQLTDPCTIYLATVWRQLPPRFWRVGEGKIRGLDALSRRARDTMSGKMHKRRARGRMVLRNDSSVTLFGVPPGAVFELPANHDPKWSARWSMRPVDFSWECLLQGEETSNSHNLSEVLPDGDATGGAEFHVRTTKAR